LLLPNVVQADASDAGLVDEALKRRVIESAWSGRPSSSPTNSTPNPVSAWTGLPRRSSPPAAVKLRRPQQRCVDRL